MIGLSRTFVVSCIALSCWMATTANAAEAVKETLDAAGTSTGTDAAPPPPPPPPRSFSVGFDKGFFIRSSDGNYALAVNGFGWLGYQLTARPAVTHNFHVGLARLAFSGNVFTPKLTYFMQIEASTFGNSNGIYALDWWLKYAFFDALSVQAGRFLLPFSRQFYTHPGNLMLPDLSAADLAFNHPRAIGAKVGGAFGRVGYDLVVVNSIRPLDATGQSNVGAGVSGGGRLEVAILDPYGYLETDPSGSTAKPQLSAGLAGFYNEVASVSVMQNTQPGDRTVNGTVDLGFRFWRVSAQGALYVRRNRYVGGGFGVDWGYYGQAGVYLLPTRIELVGRASGVVFRDRSTVLGNVNAAAGGVAEYGGGLNFYLFGHGAKLQTDYAAVVGTPFGGGTALSHRVRLQVQFLY